MLFNILLRRLHYTWRKYTFSSYLFPCIFKATKPKICRKVSRLLDISADEIIFNRNWGKVFHVCSLLTLNLNKYQQLLKMSSLAEISIIDVYIFMVIRSLIILVPAFWNTSIMRKYLSFCSRDLRLNLCRLW